MTASFSAVQRGDHAPWFHSATTSTARFAFDTVAGRYVVLCFLGSCADAASAASIETIKAHRGLFDDVNVTFFGVTMDPSDPAQGRIREMVPGIRFFLDFGCEVAKLFGSVPRDAAPAMNVPYRRQWIILDPTLRVRSVIPFAPDGSDRLAAMAAVRALPPPDAFAGTVLQAPILYLPDVFERELCLKLIELYEATGGEESGFMREIDGKTIGVMDHKHKRRRDHVVEDAAVISAIQHRIRRRVAPEIAKVHQFKVTRMERYIVGCYSAEDGGHFRAHRDNTTSGTAHRRFAISINLNSEFSGGEVSFPEYGPRSFKPPPGGAVVFSCSLLHAVSKVTEGRRYAFLPFVYDEEAARLREANSAFVQGLRSTAQQTPEDEPTS